MIQWPEPGLTASEASRARETVLNPHGTPAGTSRVSAANHTRSAGSYRTRPVWRRSTSFSCRTTGNPAAFARSLRDTRAATPGDAARQQVDDLLQSDQPTITATGLLAIAQVSRAIEYSSGTGLGIGVGDRVDQAGDPRAETGGQRGHRRGPAARGQAVSVVLDRVV